MDLKSDYKNTKELMNNAKKNLPVVSKVIIDYFQVKTCIENFTTIVSIKEIRKFTTMNQYSLLTGLKYNDVLL